MNEPKLRSAPRRTQRERSETTRQRLLEAAIEVLVERGYSRFSSVEAARIAGTSRGAVTHHFPSAEAFIIAAIENLYASILQRSKERRRSVPEDADMLEPVVQDAVDFFFSPDFSTMYDVLSAISKGGSQNAVAEIGAKYRVPVETIWGDFLVDRGLDRELANDIVWSIFSTVRGLSVRRLLVHDEDQIERTLNFILDSIRSNPAFVAATRKLS